MSQAKEPIVDIFEKPLTYRRSPLCHIIKGTKRKDQDLLFEWHFLDGNGIMIHTVKVLRFYDYAVKIHALVQLTSIVQNSRPGWDVAVVKNWGLKKAW